MEESDEEVSFSDPMILFIIGILAIIISKTMVVCIIDDSILSFPSDSSDDVIVLILQYFFIHVRYPFSCS